MAERASAAATSTAVQTSMPTSSPAKTLSTCTGLETSPFKATDSRTARESDDTVSVEVGKNGLVVGDTADADRKEGGVLSAGSVNSSNDEKGEKEGVAGRTRVTAPAGHSATVPPTSDRPSGIQKPKTPYDNYCLSVGDYRSLTTEENREVLIEAACAFLKTAVADFTGAVFPLAKLDGKTIKGLLTHTYLAKKSEALRIVEHEEGNIYGYVINVISITSCQLIIHWRTLAKAISICEPGYYLETGHEAINDVRGRTEFPNTDGKFNAGKSETVICTNLSPVIDDAVVKSLFHPFDVISSTRLANTNIEIQCKTAKDADLLYNAFDHANVCGAILRIKTKFN